MKVFVVTGDWGGAQIEDIRAVGRDVVGQFSKYFSDLNYLGSCHIIVQKSPDGCPRTIYREELSDPFFININTTGNKWAQVAYQIAHELCHVLSNHDKLRKKENQWFHEALCELASIFCLLQMSESWKTMPPYNNWKDYAPCLDSYAQEFLGRSEHKLPETPTLKNWLNENIEKLKANSCIRGLNAIVAIKLLPLFNAEPKRWESVAYIPDCNEPFEGFLKKWRSEVPERLRSFVDEVAGAFEITL